MGTEDLRQAVEILVLEAVEAVRLGARLRPGQQLLVFEQSHPDLPDLDGLLEDLADAPGDEDLGGDGRRMIPYVPLVAVRPQGDDALRGVHPHKVTIQLHGGKAGAVQPLVDVQQLGLALAVRRDEDRGEGDGIRQGDGEDRAEKRWAEPPWPLWAVQRLEVWPFSARNSTVMPST